MSDTIYIPTSDIWQDSPLICMRDMFPGLSLAEADLFMISAASSMQDWFEKNTSTNIKVTWVNQLDANENPDGWVGKFRFYRQISCKH